MQDVNFEIRPFLLDFPSLPSIENETENGTITIWQIVVQLQSGRLWYSQERLSI